MFKSFRYSRYIALLCVTCAGHPVCYNRYTPLKGVTSVTVAKGAS